MPSWIDIAAGLSLAIWLYLIALRGGFWRARERLDEDSVPEMENAPGVVAVVPARDEAAVIGRALGSLLDQDYPGPFHVVLVDDHSSDGTAAVARARAVELGCQGRLSVLSSRELPPGWAGKLWAQQQGLEQARRVLPEARYIWFSDADIRHAPDNLRRLVGKAEREGCDLVSLMALLTCKTFWERLLIPPFVFFFQKLYPFAWANDPKARTAAAAGGCVLVSEAALRDAGDLAPIKGRVIDDCALAGLIKPVARKRGRGTWVGLCTTAQSIRPYARLAEIWRMVARSAYTQLRHSPLLLAGTLIGMVFTYLVPPLAVITFPWHHSLAAAGLGLAAWLIMARAAWPTFRLYRQPAWRTLLLPLAALLYSFMTFDSALSHWRGRGAAWKGRVQQSEGFTETAGSGSAATVARGPAGR
jgi:hopene-associated glycosyltransferase HpnB